MNLDHLAARIPTFDGFDAIAPTEDAPDPLTASDRSIPAALITVDRSVPRSDDLFAPGHPSSEGTENSR